MMVRMAVVDDRVRAAASPWGLSVGEALPGGARSAVFAATDGMAIGDLVGTSGEADRQRYAKKVA